MLGCNPFGYETAQFGIGSVIDCAVAIKKLEGSDVAFP
jgi:hypothetical protein